MADDVATPTRPGRLPTLLTEGFRVFFLAAGLFAILSVTAWLAWLVIHWIGGAIPEPTIAAAPHHWHAHEMIFGYAVAVIAGFFLTAVPSWTGAPPAGPGYVTAASGLWIAGRAAIWYAAHLPPLLVAAVDLAFIPVLALKIGADLRRDPKPRNLVLLGLLLWLMASNSAIHLQWVGWSDDTIYHGERMGLFGLAALVCIIGGRIVPAFTRNALMRDGRTDKLPVSRPAVDRIAILFAVLLALGAALPLPDAVYGTTALVCGLASALRLWGWRFVETLDVPILWSLHLAYGMLAAGYLALAAAALLGWPSETGALHLLAIGGIGGMTLAVMTRAALGHTGRPLAVATPIAWAYGAIALAALIRGFGVSLLPGQYYWVMAISGGLWILGFALFVATYWACLTEAAPQSDG